jgi:predicted ATP-dependent serine protease
MNIKMGFVCKNCNFRSMRRVSECKYCGREDSIEKDKPAGELLDEVERLLHG